MVRSPRQSISVVTCLRYVLELVVKILQETNVSGHPSIDLLWVMIILQICMICEYLH